MRFIKSFGYAVEGVVHCFKLEANFRIHLVFAVVAIAGGCIFHVSSAEWLVLLFCIGLVLSLELVNTAIEQLCNMITSDRMPQIKIIKDVSAAAVLLSAFISFLIGAFIFIPKLLSFLNRTP